MWRIATGQSQALRQLQTQTVLAFESSNLLYLPSRTGLFNRAKGLPCGFGFFRGSTPAELQPDRAARQESLRVLVTGSLPFGDGQAFVKVFPGAPRAAPEHGQQAVLAQGVGQVVLEALRQSQSAPGHGLGTTQQQLPTFGGAVRGLGCSA